MEQPIRTISVTRALRELKGMDTQILQLAGQPLVFIQKGTTNPEVLGQPNMTPEAMKRATQGNFDKVKAKIAERAALKAAVVKSNAVTVVKISGKEMTVAEAIELKTHISVLKSVQGTHLYHYQNVQQQVIKGNAEMDRRIEVQLNDVYKREKGKLPTPEERNEIASPIEKSSKLELVDPTGIAEYLQSNQDFLINFENEVDFTLSEINAKTEIQVQV